MYWLVDILVVLFIGVMLYNGISKGFMNTTFTLVTAILWIALAAGCAFALVYFVFPLFGWDRELQMGMLHFSGGLNLIWELVGISAEEGALYVGYVFAGLPLFIAFYIFWLWVGRRFEQFVRFVRRENLFFRILGSFLGGVIHLAFAGGLVLGLFWVFSAVDGSGLFTFTNETIRAAHLSGLIYEHNPLNSLLGEHGCYAELVYNIINANFHLL